MAFWYLKPHLNKNLYPVNRAVNVPLQQDLIFLKFVRTLIRRELKL